MTDTAPDLTKPCRTCRWSHRHWLDRLAVFVFQGVDLGLKECRHPTVRSEWHRNIEFRWLAGHDAIEPAAPVTERGEVRRICCFVARSAQTIWTRAPDPVAFRPAPEELRAPSNCGPEGRYWERRP